MLVRQVIPVFPAGSFGGSSSCGSAAGGHSGAVDLDSFVRSFFDGAPAVGPTSGTRRPTLNAWENEQSLVVEAELPGFTMEQLDITLDGEELTIAGSRDASGIDGINVLRREGPLSGEAVQFKRTVRVSVPVDSERVNATLDRGVLRIELPKAEHARPRKIAVNAKS